MIIVNRALIVPRKMVEDDPIATALGRLYRAGRTLGDTAFRTTTGELVWLVFGQNDENVIRAEGPTGDEAWQESIEQAGAVGMLDGIRAAQAQGTG